MSKQHDPPRRIADLRGFATLDDIQVIGALPENVAEQIGIPTSARSVWIGQTGLSHIAEQRSRDAEFVLVNMGAVIRHPLFFGLDPRTPRRVWLVEYVRSRHLCLTLKFVAAERAGTKADEIWIVTSHPLGEASLRRYLRTGKLQPVTW